MKKVAVCLFLASVFLFSQVVFSTIPSDSTRRKTDTSIKIGILNFGNDTNYHGKEDPAQKIPILLGKYLASKIEYISIVPHDSLQAVLKTKKLSSSDLKLDDEEDVGEICKDLPVDVVLLGNLKNFNVTRFSVGNPMLGGYGSYKAIIEIRFKLVRASDSHVLLDTVIKNKEGEKNLDITLLGKPSGKMREFMSFETLCFESDEFKDTLIGNATLDAFAQIEEHFKELVKPPSLQLSGREHLAAPCVILVKDDIVYINIGFDDGAKPGDKFIVQRTGAELREPESGKLLGYVYNEVGVVQIFQMESGHLSKANIIKKKEEIKAGDLIKIK